MATSAFGKSFEKSFQTGFSAGSSVALEGIKEKIKKQEEKTLKENEKLQAQKDYEKIRQYIKSQNPELATSLEGLDVTDIGTDTLNNINKLLSNQFKPQSPTDRIIEQGKIADAALKIYEAGGRDIRGEIFANQPSSTNQQTGQQTNTSPQILGSTDSPISQPSEQPSQTTNVSPNDTIVTKRNTFGVPTEVKSKRVIKIENDLKAQGETATQAAKEAQKAERDFMNADLKIGNTLDSFIDYSERQKEITGLDPGPLSGALSSLITGPLQLNEFRDGLLGGLVEVASASARTSMPGTRAIRAIDIFKKTTVNPFETIESGIQNSADSYRNALTTDMANNPSAYIDGYDEMSRDEKRASNKKLRSIAQDWEKDFVDTSIKEIWKRGKQRGVNLLKPETIKRVEDSLPEFDSIEEGDKNVAPGDFYKVGSEIIEAG